MMKLILQKIFHLLSVHLLLVQEAILLVLHGPQFGLPNNALSAVRCLPAVGTPAIALFRHHHYFGVMQVLNSSNPNLALINFDDLVSSLVITGGVWELYSEVNYTGSNVTLGQGRYPTPFFLTPIVNDDLTSVRLIAFGKFRAF